MKKTLTFNQKLEKLQEIIGKLESGELELEEVEKLVNSGLTILKQARTQLNQLESKVTKILKES